MPAALAGWGDLAPILIFLAISAYVNWKRKQAEQNQGQPTPQPRQPGTPVATPARQQAPARATREDWDDGEDIEDHDGEDWDGEHSERWDDRGGRENRSVEARSTEDRTEHLASRPAPAPEAQRNVPAERGETQPAAPGKAKEAKEKAQEVGKDLLTQLAKELGLELPQPGRPVPKPAPKPAAPPPAQAPRAPAKPPAPPPRSHPVSPDEVRARAAEASRSRSPQVTPAPLASLPPSGRGVAAPAVSAAEIGSPEALRRAFILKTILDKPVSMRPPGERA